MDEDYIEEDNPYNEKAQEEQVDNDELDDAEEGFIKGYEDGNEESSGDDADDDEKLTD